ncbi:MAG: hypothetical protein V4687_14240 [Bacteroidota bacterium]
MKKLKQAQEKEQRQERQSQKLQLQDAVIGDALSITRFSFKRLKLHIPFSSGMPQSIKNSIFHPPQLG